MGIIVLLFIFFAFAMAMVAAVNADCTERKHYCDKMQCSDCPFPCEEKDK